MTGDMDITSWFWILIFLMFFAPVLQQRWLIRTRRKFIRKIENDWGSRVIVLLHRQEFLSLLGLPFFRYINIEDSEQVIRAIHKTDPNVPIDFIIHTPGGLVLASTQIAQALNKHKARVRIFVPHYAMSGGTLLALSADEIVMHPNAVLGPLDPQIDRYPAVSILKAIRRKPLAKVEDRTLILADQAEKAIAQIRRTISQLLRRSTDIEKANELASTLSSGQWTHDYPIGFEEAKEMGLSVSSEIPDEVMDLMELYPQPTRRQTNVEYLPEEKKLPSKKTA